MKKLVFSLVGAMALTSAAYAGTETYAAKDKEVQQTAPFCNWYADREWNVSVWGTYAFTGNEYREDRYLGVDHAWGGGLDAKYFFSRYFGLGVQGFGLALNNNNNNDANRRFLGIRNNDDFAGAAVGTFTFRYPLPCSRFAPYVWAGGGAIFGGGGREEIVVVGNHLELRNGDDEGRLMGQFGGGIEVRLTPHVGLINDLSWNVIDGSGNNFGMVRTGVNFSF
jgi:hypothetical protein